MCYCCYFFLFFIILILWMVCNVCSVCNAVRDFFDCLERGCVCGLMFSCIDCQYFFKVFYANILSNSWVSRFVNASSFDIVRESFDFKWVFFFLIPKLLPSEFWISTSGTTRYEICVYIYVFKEEFCLESSFPPFFLTNWVGVLLALMK